MAPSSGTYSRGAGTTSAARTRRNAGAGGSNGKGKSKGKGRSRGYRWVPKQELSPARKNSILTTRSFADIGDIGGGFDGVLESVGGRLAHLKSGSALLDPLECLFIEPPGKRLDPKGYLTTGMVIWLDGMPPTAEALEECCQVVESAGWLDLGVSVAIPNVQMSSALEVTDLEAVVSAVCDAVGFNHCLLLGKGWGAQRAVELATGSNVSDCVEGLILAGPSSPAPASCCDVDVPVLVLWAQDDDLSPFEEHEAWLEGLVEGSGPTSFQVTEEGGHRVDRILACEGLSETVRNFTASTLLISHLAQEELFEEQALSDSEEEEEEEDREAAAANGAENPRAMNRRRSDMLAAKLPPFLRQDAACAGINDDGEACQEAEHVRSGMDAERRIRKKLSMELPQWIQAGLPTAAE